MVSKHAAFCRVKSVAKGDMVAPFIETNDALARYIVGAVRISTHQKTGVLHTGSFFDPNPDIIVFP